LVFGAKIYKHRLDGPSENYRNGETGWCQKDKYHREDGPAVSRPDGYEAWIRDDKFHRIDGPAVTYPNGVKCWYIDGLKHREDGPAVEYPCGLREWWQNDLWVKSEHAEPSLEVRNELARWQRQWGFEIEAAEPLMPLKIA
jgi:hypothetical protein